MTDDGLPSVGRRDRLILRARPAARGYRSARDRNDGSSPRVAEVAGEHDRADPGIGLLICEIPGGLLSSQDFDPCQAYGASSSCHPVSPHDGFQSHEGTANDH
jgi:hypothetical protein